MLLHYLIACLSFCPNTGQIALGSRKKG